MRTLRCLTSGILLTALSSAAFAQGVFLLGPSAKTFGIEGRTDVITGKLVPDLPESSLAPTGIVAQSPLVSKSFRGDKIKVTIRNAYFFESMRIRVNGKQIANIPASGQWNGAVEEGANVTVIPSASPGCQSTLDQAGMYEISPSYPFGPAKIEYMGE